MEYLKIMEWKGDKQNTKPYKYTIEERKRIKGGQKKLGDLKDSMFLSIF